MPNTYRMQRMRFDRLRSLAGQIFPSSPRTTPRDDSATTAANPLELVQGKTSSHKRLTSGKSSTLVRGLVSRLKNSTAGRFISYAPNLDGDADPGEVVWTWVPYEEDPSQGKDRPVLIVAREGSKVLGLQLSSKQHRHDDSNWVSIGRGKWDRQGRQSYARLDRVLTLDPNAIRREGGAVKKKVFTHVATRLHQQYDWQQWDGN